MFILSDIFQQVFQAIWAHKLRSFLTMFGIAWGVASLLLLIGLGEGFRSGQREGMSQMGTDVIMMWNGTIPAVPGQHQGMRPYQLTVEDAAAVKAGAPDVRNSTALINRGDLKQVSEYSSAGGSVLGVEANFPEVRNMPMGEGRFLNAADVEQRRMVAVLGKKSAQLLFSGRQTIGSYVLLNGYRFQVIGIGAQIGRGNNDGDNQQVYIPLTTMMQLFPMKGENLAQDAISSIQYQPTTADKHGTAKAEVHRIIAVRHGFDPALKEAYEEWDSILTMEMVGAIFTSMDLFLGGVGVVTLMLGAVGVINIMLVTVTERTKEIGLRKALGATNRSIMSQFFLEGLFLTGFSGIIGIAAAAGLMAVLDVLFSGGQTGFGPPRLVGWSAALALGSLMVCGVVAGVYPAYKAAMLQPVEALRKD